MNIEKEAFELYFMKEEELKVEFARLMDLMKKEGKGDLEAAREIRKAASHYFSYKATEQQKEVFAEYRRERCYKVVANCDLDGEAFLTTVYGLTSTEMVSYGKSHAYNINARYNFDVAGRKFIAASNKKKNAIPENEETYLKFAKQLCYANYKQIDSFLRRNRIDEAYLQRMMAFLKENHPYIYDNVMINIRISNIINSTSVEDEAEGRDLIEKVKNNILNNPKYSIFDFYNDTNGLSTGRCYSLYIKYFSINTDPNFRKIASFLKNMDESDNIFSADSYIARGHKNADGEIEYKHFTEEEKTAVLSYIKERGLPYSMSLYGLGLDLIEKRPELFTTTGPKKA